MKFSPFRFFAFVCVLVTLCPAIGCGDDSARKKEGAKGVNIFNIKPKKDEPPPNSNTPTPSVIQGMQRAGDPQKKEIGRAAWYYTFLLFGVAIVVAGVVCWRMWRQRRAEWELNDPMALVKELVFVHQLSDQDKRFMQELSEKNSLTSPLSLFVEPKFLLDALESDSFISAQTSVRRLLAKLFDITADEDDAPAAVNSGDVPAA